ncbi:sensor histidine kinase [Gracilibacillus oryzae]|uniref:Sensor histidine kinase n=1 Tax=Gracilibacillus oryzae TaxID=1672701 RepID=A0A7C8GWS2_9BACI|nr:ATP-binding protein [Gracilibacillus oryzae]KAB8139246.1 sensor histidine kinase [Gracilibacillus oryzae]
MEVLIPSNFNRFTMYDLLSSVIDNDLNPKDTVISFNFTKLKFIEPAGVTILSNLFEWLHKRGVSSRIIYPENCSGKKNPIQFLDDSNFFMRYAGKNLTRNPNPRPTTIPLKLVAYSDGPRWLEREFSFWLSNQLNIPLTSLATIRICFGEIFNNIRDHAQENIGCIFAQHYPGSNEIKITISDFGVGIPENIRRVRPSLQDDEAVMIATTEGFTSQTSPRNLGAGLHTLIENVVKNNNGSVHIHSNYGILNCTKGIVSNEVEKFASLKGSFYPGTLIETILKTDSIQNITDIEEEFEW